jgi:hypothetical protein
LATVPDLLCKPKYGKHLRLYVGALDERRQWGGEPEKMESRDIYFTHHQLGGSEASRRKI